MNLGLQLLHLVLDGHDLLVARCAHLIDLNFGIGLLDFPGFLNRGSQLLLRLSQQPLPLFLGRLLKSFLAVHLLLKQVVILAIVMLDVCGQLGCMLLFQSLNGLVVVFEIKQLTLVVLATLIELPLHVLQVHLHVLRLLFVLFLHLGLSLRHRLLIQLVFPLAFRALPKVLLFYLLHFLFQVLAILQFSDLVLLPQNDLVGLSEDDFHFLLVATANRLLCQVVLLVL